MKKILQFYTLLFSAIVAISILSCEKSLYFDAGNSSTGKGGSMARFTIVNNYLYTVSLDTMTVVNISDRNNPIVANQFSLGWNNDIETIYPFKNYLFIGSKSAMHIYSLDDPANPVMAGYAQHTNSCDPVVANDSIAFVTLRGGTSCNQSNINELQVYDITTIMNPQRISTTDLTEPYGLALNGNILYVCDNKEGIVIFDVSDPYNARKIKSLGEYNPRDCIVHDNMLVVMNAVGMIIYDITEPLEPTVITEVTQ